MQYLDLVIYEPSPEMEAPRISLLVLRWYLDHSGGGERGDGSREDRTVTQQMIVSFTSYKELCYASLSDAFHLNLVEGPGLVGTLPSRPERDDCAVVRVAVIRKVDTVLSTRNVDPIGDACQ
jgi:hypothetical protein